MFYMNSFYYKRNVPINDRARQWAIARIAMDPAGGKCEHGLDGNEDAWHVERLEHDLC